MKHLLLSTALLLSAASTMPALAQERPGRLVEFIAPESVDDDGPLSLPRHVGFGMTPRAVMDAMKGKPDEKPAADLWVYWHFRAGGAPELQKYNTLVIYFVEGRVAKYRLVERQALAALLKAVQANANSAPAVATK
jgi:hypothetical protein